MYLNNTLQVRIKDKMTSTFEPKIGVRQGDNLSPNLFNIFINDLPNMFDEADDQVELDNLKISTLLYADDLMLISKSKPGLQRCLDKLSTYCKINCLTVNLKKTKVVVFCKGGKISCEKFYFNSIEIENTNSYKYLGVVFSASGTYKHCEEDLYKRALRAQFKLTKCFSSSAPRLDTLLHLFEHTVEPIATYGCEIWGTVNFLSSKVKKANFQLENLLENFACDKLHIKFLKYISGMNKASCNIALLSEFGRYPLSIKVLVNTCKYLQRLLTTDSGLLQCAYKESSLIASRGKMSWVSCVEFLLKQLKVANTMVYQKKFSTIIKSKLINRFKENITNTLMKCTENKEGKLRTYAIFKTIFQKEKYLSVIQDVSIRKCFMSFRISSHKLEIERGRHKRHSVEKRVCIYCSSNTVEDEKHFIFECSLYDSLRQNFFTEIKKLCKHFSNLSQEARLIWLMPNECDEIIFLFSRYIYDCFSLRSISKH